MGALSNPAFGALSYLVSVGIGSVLGYYFARKRTEHEVAYGRRVEVVERVQLMLVSVEEAFEAALAYVRDPGPSEELPVKEIERTIDELERYYARQEIWLDRRTFAELDALTVGLRARQRTLERLPRSYGDPDFEREHRRAAAELREWMGSGLPEARERLTGSFRAMLGVGRRGLLP